VIAKEVLIEFVQGQKQAFDKIYAAYAPGMYGICLRYTRCDDDAKDVLQESFIKIYQSREKYNVDLPIGAWIKTITIRTALNYIKDNYRLILTDDEMRFDRSVFEEEHEDNNRELKEKLLQVLQQLPDGYRTVFNLYTIDNLTHKEIAEYLDITEGTSKSQYFKAKKMIHHLLESEKVER
jgi:RNA polymerase sigma-70 factor (ECF subfamily)